MQVSPKDQKLFDKELEPFDQGKGSEEEVHKLMQAAAERLGACVFVSFRFLLPLPFLVRVFLLG